jgi:flagellar hook-associated protein 1 FlgK
VLERGQALLDSIHNRYERLRSIRDMINDDIVGTVRQINDITAEIAQLGRKIVKIEAMGDRPNDLYDRRDLLVGQLSELVDVEISNRDPDEFTVYTGGRHLVQGGHHEALEWDADPENEGYALITWPEGGEARFRGGSLAGLMELRDVDLREEIQSLDTATINFIDLVNEIHRAAYGMGGSTGEDFFIEYPFINNLSGNYDRDGDGEFDTSYVFRITGANTLDPQEQIGLRGTMSFAGPTATVSVEYFPTDTVGDLVERINLSGAEVAARLNADGRLTLKGMPAADTGNPDFVLRRVEDSSQFLVGYAGLLAEAGADGAYDFNAADAVLGLRGGAEYAVAPLAHPAGWIAINPLLSANPEYVAGAMEGNGRSAGEGDGRAALAIAQLRTEPVMVGRISTFDDFFAQSAANIGLKGETAERSVGTIALVMKELEDLRQAVSGVNVDEELANMIKFQHGYSAAARFISEMDQMIDTIINRMGV